MNFLRKENTITFTESLLLVAPSPSKRCKLISCALLAAASLWLRFLSNSGIQQNNVTTVIATEEAKPSKECKFASKVLGLKNVRCPDCLSQFDQDIILQNIFEIIGTTNKHCAEFGYGYNIDTLVMDDFLHRENFRQGLNTHKLIQQGWRPVFFDAEFENAEINLIKAVLTEDTICAEFEKAKIPLDADYVSIDVDSVDIWLLNGLLKGGYRPRVISVEHNSNFMAHMPVACRREWAPWKNGSRIYGTSAAAINFVGEQYGYKVVDIMKDLDVFLIRNDVLEASCSNVGDLPTFQWLADGKTGVNCHRFCDPVEAAERFVDVPLMLAGDEKGASIKAMEYVKEVNEYRTSRGMPPMCG